MEHPDLITEAQAYFFEAMIAGYTGNVSPTPHPSLVGYDQIIHQRGPFLLDDSWCKFGGRTLVYYNDVPIWAMRYCGSYPASVIPLLKQALFTSYNYKQFHGCRGPAKFSNPEQNNFVYVNNYLGSFREFSGEERILNMSLSVNDPKRVIGEHAYWGGMLIGDNDSFRIA